MTIQRQHPEPDAPGSRAPGAGAPGSGVEDPRVLDSAYLQILARGQSDDRRTLKWALAAAILVHAVLLFIHFPKLQQPVEVEPGSKRKAYVVQQVRFRPPQAAPKQQLPEEKKKRKIPIPDPTPDDPEPIRELAVESENLDLDLPVGALNFDIPDGPPGPAGPSFGDGPLQVGGDVLPPVKVYYPQPRYTEEARQARIQGVTLLQAVIDTEGNVSELRILKGLPLGLDQSAMETVRQWKFEPATRDGVPVPVYYNLTVSFTLQ